MKQHVQVQVLQFNQFPLSVDKDYYNVVVVLEGSCEVKRFSKVQHFESQDAFFINEGEVYSMASKEGCIIEKMMIPATYIEKEHPLLRLIDSIGNMDQEKEISLIYRDIVFLKDVLHSYSSNSQMNTLIDKIISAFVTDYDTINYENGQYRYIDAEQAKRFYRILANIKTSYTNKTSLNDIAIQEEMQKTNLATQFKQISGYTFLEYLNRYRLTIAENLLLQGKLTNAEIIKECGFSDSKYFYKYFMEEFNTTPAKWKSEYGNLNGNVKTVNEQQAKEMIERMNEQFSEVNVDTNFFNQYTRLKKLIENKIDLSTVKLELDLYHPDNLVYVEGNTINTWYGLDLIFNYVKEYEAEPTLLIHMDTMDNYRLDELLTQIDRMIHRHGIKVMKNCRFVATIENPYHFDNAKWLEKQIEKKIPGARFEIIC